MLDQQTFSKRGNFLIYDFLTKSFLEICGFNPEVGLFADFLYISQISPEGDYIEVFPRPLCHISTDSLFIL